MSNKALIELQLRQLMLLRKRSEIERQYEELRIQHLALQELLDEVGNDIQRIVGKNNIPNNTPLLKDGI